MISLELTTKEDIHTIHNLQKQIFKNLYNKYQDGSSPYLETTSILNKKFNQQNSYFYFIKKNNKVIGYIRILIDIEQNKARIGPVGLLPQYDGKGYGTKAILVIENEFPSIKEWHLSTIFQEDKLRHFYSKLGYDETGELESIQNNMDLIHFVKFINK